ncbi:hypothetical protein QFC22_000625 [Naganishia vaughanmartiniae]|uniref:Uncharacterized protein n=1 Tax=Naganishia vaughanmartiniae TaxID=1424756 RepID=A0ACC2XNU0_9TREE|nr:hypothetical protein QFC22_000625 [Naganishia vaughanmartiniae]
MKQQINDTTPLSGKTKERVPKRRTPARSPSETSEPPHRTSSASHDQSIPYFIPLSDPISPKYGAPSQQVTVPQRGQFAQGELLEAPEGSFYGYYLNQDGMPIAPLDGGSMTPPVPQLAAQHINQQIPRSWNAGSTYADIGKHMPIQEV